MSVNQKYLLCKKMNLYNCNSYCLRSHNIDELEVIDCHYGNECKMNKCPFMHPKDNITKQNYYKRMYEYILPYETEYTSVCRYTDIGCKIEKCRKAHSADKLIISKCDCFKLLNCPFYHENRDKNITKEQYFIRMKNWVKTLKKSNKELLCRYINIGCRRNNCPYAHNIKELNIHKCIFTNCKSDCVFLHNNETIGKQEYFERMLKFILPIKPFSVLCEKKNCNNKCMYAHTFEEFLVTSCIRGIKCKKHCCPFKHPGENLDKDTYYNRMSYAHYPN